MSNSKQINRLRYLSTVLGMSFVIGFTGCGKTNDMSFGKTMYGVCDNTCFDELVGNDYIKLLSNLELYLECSDSLNNFSLEDNTISTDYRNCQLFDADYLLSLIEDYENKDYNTYSKDELNNILYIQNKLVNEHIYFNGYDVVSYGALMGVKASIADTVGLTYEEAKNIKIMNKKDFDSVATDFNPTININVGNDIVDIGKCSELVDLIYINYDVQTNASKVSPDARPVYNKDRNKLLKDAINKLKICLASEYKIDQKRRIKNK